MTEKILLQNVIAALGGPELEACDIRIRDGRFSTIAPPNSLEPHADEHLLHPTNLIVLPGMIDGHVHFDDPGYEWRETFHHGTCAAAAGGVTTIVDMPCTSLPPVTNLANLQTKLDAVSKRACVDFMFWGGICANGMHPDAKWEKDLQELKHSGVAAIKAYLLSGMKSFLNLSEEQLVMVALACRRLKLPLAIHAEDRETVERLAQESPDPTLSDAETYYRSRPSIVEERAVERAIAVAEATGAQIHIVHLGSGKALDLIASARSRGVTISAESAPHYLSFTWKDLERLGSILKTAPPVKTETDRERLWQGVIDGDISFLATDHAAAKWPEEKQTGSFKTDYSGIPGVELLLPWLHSMGVIAGRITYQDLVRLISSAPAEFFGITHCKGAIREGLDADFVLFDPSAEWTVDANTLHNLNPYTPFDGQSLQGRVEETWLRGYKVFSRGAPNELPHNFTGQFVRRNSEDGTHA
jgi:allantoinase